jgi:succinate dehydrogenase/fumarate reductase flavoprotein subunit
MSKVDLLVIGGGMAGMSAATWVAQHGGTAVVVEKGSAVGGSAAFAGYVWTAPTYTVLRAENPGGDPALARALVDDVQADVEWMESLGVACEAPIDKMRFGRGRHVDTTQYFGICSRLLRDAHGCEVLLDSTAERLLLDGPRVVGAEVHTPEGPRTIEAANTLLATGGYQGDDGLRAQHIHPEAPQMVLRSNPRSDGAGLRLGLEAGARFGKPNAGFYGHLIPLGIRYDEPTQFAMKSMYCSEHAVLVNTEGSRFADETLGDHLNTQAVLEQPGSRALMIADQRTYEQWCVTPFVVGAAPIDKFEIARASGGRIATAADLEEFEYLPPEWGYPGSKVRATIEAFNEACRNGGPEPTRRYDRAPLDQPPYYVVDVVPAITFTFGGLLIDDQARALDEAGHPIPGLLAAGADSGGVFVRAYAGGLANALVFGLRAARTACAAAA